MSSEPLILVAHAEPRVEHASPIVERPASSVEQQRLADEVFSREQHSTVAALLAMQTGLAVVQHLVAETFRPTTEAERREREDDEPVKE